MKFDKLKNFTIFSVNTFSEFVDLLRNEKHAF